jgi:hypothetical protein
MMWFRRTEISTRLQVEAKQVGKYQGGWREMAFVGGSVPRMMLQIHWNERHRSFPPDGREPPLFHESDYLRQTWAEIYQAWSRYKC